MQNIYRIYFSDLTFIFQKCTNVLWQLLFFLAVIWKTWLFSSQQHFLMFVETSESVVTMIFLNFMTWHDKSHALTFPLELEKSWGEKWTDGPFNQVLTSAESTVLLKVKLCQGEHVKLLSYKEQDTWRLPLWWRSMLLAVRKPGK